ncbi:MAG: ArsR family transcriptional regulator, partial [Nevskiaceae bacterium]
MSLSLEQGTAICRLLADASRLRLLLLLDAHELTVAELTQVTRLAQSRVSTHL